MDLNIPTEIWSQTPTPIQEVILGLSQYVNSAQNTIGIYDRQVALLTHQVELHQSAMFSALCKVSAASAHRPREARSVAFVCPRPLSRQLKLAYGLKQQGWKVSLIAERPEGGRFDFCREQDKIFDEIHLYSDSMEAVALTLAISPLVYHCFSSWDFALSEQIIKVKPGKIVFDDYDILSGTMQPAVAANLEKAVPREKYCFENADGICNRSLTAQLVKKSYQIGGKFNFFPEYCWNQYFPRQAKRTDGIHFVYVGDIAGEYFNDALESSCCDQKFIEMITQRGFHYHLYPTRWGPGGNAENVPKHYQYSLKNPLFHLHEPLPYLNLIEEISQYHFGVCVCSKRAIEEGNWAYNPAPYRYHLNNKVFDYVDAGLIPLVSGGPTMHWFFERLGAAEIVHREEFEGFLDRVEQGDSFGDVTAGVERAQGVYDVGVQAGRLGKFYESL